MRIQKVPWQWPQRRKGQINISILDDPQKQLSLYEGFFDQVVEQADDVVSRSFGSCLKGCDSTREHLLNVDLIAIAYSDKILGFVSAKIFKPHNLLYIHGVVVDPSVKGKGVCRFLIDSLIKKEGVDWLSFTTQNPVMFKVLNSFCGEEVYPSPNSSAPSSLEGLAKNIIQGREGTFDAQTFVVSNLYQECLYDSIPSVTDQDLHQWFNDSLCIDELRKSNHGFLFFGKIYH